MSIQDLLESYDNACGMCHRVTSLQIHHKQLKGMGGRKRKAKLESESIDNLIPLCIVCHSARHHIRAIEGDFSCDKCIFQCEYSQIRTIK